MSFVTTTIAVVTLLGCALMGGVFFAFSSFIMRALARLPSSQGIAVMQSINVVVLNPFFLGVFMGTAAASLVVAALSVASSQLPSSLWFLSGAVSYLVATFLVTGLGNVPLNKKLAALSASDPTSAQLWEDYVHRWTFLNTVRTVGALGAAVFFTIGLIVHTN